MRKIYLGQDMHIYRITNQKKSQERNHVTKYEIILELLKHFETKNKFSE